MDLWRTFYVLARTVSFRLDNCKNIPNLIISETKMEELQLFKTVGLVIQKIQKDAEKVWGLIGSIN